MVYPGHVVSRLQKALVPGTGVSMCGMALSEEQGGETGEQLGGGSRPQSGAGCSCQEEVLGYLKAAEDLGFVFWGALEPVAAGAFWWG